LFPFIPGPASLVSSALAGLLLLVAGAACTNSNQSGRVSAIGTGQLFTPGLERITAEARTHGPCGGNPAPDAAEGVLRRQPYLQKVGANGAVVVWTSTSTAVDVTVTTPDGAPVATVEGVIDVTAPLARGVRQWAATLEGLSPASQYCYQVRDQDQAVLAAGWLRTAPAPGTGARVQVVALGDSGAGGSDQRALLAQLGTVPFDLMVHTGDIAYDNGTLGDFESKFFGVYAPLLTHTPVFPSSGNHDYETDDAAPFRQVYLLPENGGLEGLERWYSFDWGDVHFVALDTERMGAAQAAWLEADLTANQLPWTIVYGHRPPFSSGEHGGDPNFRRIFNPILEAHGVQLVLTGHDHHYERFHPVAGITHVVTGGGGRGTRGVNPGPMTAFGEAVIHLVVVTVENDTLTLHAIDGVGREFDSTIIQNPAADSSNRAPASGE
jgi:hypothetical protein